MNTHSDTSEHSVVVTRVSESRWHAIQDGLVVGHGDASHRPDGRTFLSVDAWHGAIFDRLADTMPSDLPTPLYTVVDEADVDLTSAWQRAGFAVERREWDYFAPTDPGVTGLGSVRPPLDVTIVPVGEAESGPLRALDRAVRDELVAADQWQAMPAEVEPYPERTKVVDTSKYAAALHHGRYVGLVHVSPGPRRARIGLIAVLAAHRRRGIGRVLLAHALDSLHRHGIASAAVDISESNEAAVALFEDARARRVGSVLELVRV
ncbi:GNAT family N-acetyltransferase [Streptomyces sp. NPDC059193]|uniref:GNAT family N-acetyltransferase n=1 Tax=Streptomyces sp. NPDC059193 TaxID=3346763 RepID=UPI0036BDFFD2